MLRTPVRCFTAVLEARVLQYYCITIHTFSVQVLWYARYCYPILRTRHRCFGRDITFNSCGWSFASNEMSPSFADTELESEQTQEFDPCDGCPQGAHHPLPHTRNTDGTVQETTCSLQLGQNCVHTACVPPCGNQSSSHDLGC